MKLRFSHLFLIAVSLAGPAYAFMPNPDMLSVSPAVAKAGETVEVTIAGKELDEVDLLRFTHPNIVGKPVLLPADEFHPEPRPVKNKFTVTIPADVKPGVYEVRSRGYFGLSTARPFLILPKDSVELVEEGDHSSLETAMDLSLEAGILGTLDTGKFDWYRFPAQKGQRILVHLTAEQLDSRADTLLAVCSADGRELESSRHHVGRDPFVDFTAPADGTYYVSLTDSLYMGGKEYFYHLRVSERPHVDFVFPPAGEPGTTRGFTFFGRNLPGGSLGGDWKWKGKPLETVEKQVAVPAEVSTHPDFDSAIPRQGILPAFKEGVDGSNQVKIGFATAPVTLEDRNLEEQKVPVPTEVAGRFDEPGDTDTFRIQAKKGQALWLEVVSHRLGVVADPFVMVEKVIKDEKGTETFTKVGENDDLESFYGRDSFDDLNADSLDPAMSFTADTDGEYRITLINQSAGGSPAHRYRLAIREAQHGFQLLIGTELTKTINNDAFPAAPLLRKGGSMVYRVLAFRNDGFDGDIEVIAKGLPPGVTAEPLVLSGNSREGFLTLWSTPDVKPWSGPIDIVGTAKVGGAEKTSIARPASILWGTRVFGNANQIRSRLDMETVLSVIDSETEPTRISVKGENTLEVVEGGTLEIPIQLTETGKRTGNLQIDVHGFPGLHRSPPQVAIPEKDKEGILKFPFVKSGNFDLSPGTYQFVLRGVGNRKYERNPAAVQRTAREHERLKALYEEYPKQVAASKAEQTTAEKELALAKQKEAAAADDAAREALKGATAAAEKRVNDAVAAVKAREAALAKLKTATEAAAKEASAAATTAKEKSNQFATFSQPITVVVKAKE
jgi:IS5 family transposase